ncbi:MAG: hypothetical protein GY832_37685 [Chloroflexi bacterium]|nr:hypothetical protein [Chloroflexota bacterium]
MPIQHVNRRGQTYYLHQGTTKTGKPKYFFSKKSGDDLVSAIPDGFEIYENPNSQVFLRKIRPKIISDNEIAVVEKGMKRFSLVQHYLVDAKKDIIILFVANQNIDRLSELLQFAPRDKGESVQDLFAQLVSYSPMLRFALLDKGKRLFVAQRYCFRGSIDDWITIGVPDTLQKLVKTYVKHLEQDSYFELF